MLESANQIISQLKVGSLIGTVKLSATDAETIDPTGYSIINITQAGAAETRTLANGVEGQFLWIINTAYAADTVVTAALAGSNTNITFNVDEDVWFGVFLSGEWHTLDIYGSTALA
jgi:GTPase